MDRRTKVKVIAGITILVVWIILVSGITRAPAFIWFLLIIITFIFYIGATSSRFKRRKSSKAVMEDMEDYMRRKAEERLGETKNKNSSEEQDEEEYDFEDDIKVIKK